MFNSLIILTVIVAFYVVQGLSPPKNAFVSTLLSDDFLLAARVLAHNLHQLHPEIPYLILYTDGVNNRSVDLLGRHPNVQLKQVERIDTPQLATHRAKKFQYTKINLWSLTDFKQFVYIDLDIILIDHIDELFRCGSFCASLRHSDSFNSGVMVIQPNFEIYADMINKTNALESYDGGDQGFLNSYFWELKYAPMYRPNKNQSISNNIQRLSSAYNYDVGMYYLSGRMLVQPKLIHFTLAFVKPWHWYGYPLFDLNWHWLSNRMDMERTYQPIDSALNLCVFIKSFLTFLLLFILYQLSGHVQKCPARSELNFSPLTFIAFCPPINVLERKVTPIYIFSMALWLSLKLTPMQLIPHIGWCLFTVNFSLSMSLLTATYSRLRFSVSHLFWTFLLILLLLTCIHLIGWHVMIRIAKPTNRILTVVSILFIYATSVYHLLGWLLYGQVPERCRRWTSKDGEEEMSKLTCIEGV
ncbi:hypothetical protein M3Y97_01085800 [Aphelenchoides bicaudatus]|nr:hypothetical protein M3Y97_01085800 [Aphelenchoides bicaudatus]